MFVVVRNPRPPRSGAVAVRKSKGDPFLAARARAFEEMAPELADAFLEAIQETASDLTLTELRDALESGNPATVVEALDWQDIGVPYLQNALPPILRKALEDSGSVSATVLGKQTDAGGLLAFDITSEAAQAWVRDEGGKLIKDATAAQLDTLRSMIGAVYQDRISSDAAAKMFRDSQVFGLTDLYSGALLNYRDRLIEDGTKMDTVNTLVQRKADFYLDLRADNIARTEIADAYQQGKSELWDQAVEKGYIQADEAEVEWVVQDPCDQCSQYDGMVIGVGEDFPEGDPPLHPRCECDRVLHAFGKEED